MRTIIEYVGLKGYANFSEYAAPVKVGKVSAFYGDIEFNLNEQDRIILFQLEENLKSYLKDGNSDAAEQMKTCFKYLHNRTSKA